MGALAELAAAADPALVPYAVADPPTGEWEPRLADANRAFVFEAVYEAFQLHYGAPRVFDGMDDELRLLAGDAIYALALERLADVGDVEAIAELADLISLSAVAQAEGRTELVRRLWEAGADALAGRGRGARAEFAAARPGP
jgi:hypothetical protein